jgi:uncharacterized protein
MAKDILVFDKEPVALGESKDLRLKVSETYTGDEIRMPIRVIRAQEPGPIIFITAAIHGDEINGTGIIHDFLFGDAVNILKGTLILVPVVNVFGFETHERYLPDRRDLNRSFPGSSQGSLASRIAHKLMTEVVRKCEFGIDLHSAAFQRTNYPNVRADLTRKPVRDLARSFGAALIVDGKGPVGSFRREATKAGCPTIILEAGEPWKIEPSVLQIGVQGIRNTLISLGMMNGTRIEPPYQAIIRKSTWLRASVGGILKFHVTAGEFVEKDQPVATNYSILGREQNTLVSPQDGIILGIATMPAVKPGEPVCHIAFPNKRITELRRKMKNFGSSSLRQAGRDLATNIDVIAPNT